MLTVVYLAAPRLQEKRGPESGEPAQAPQTPPLMLGVGGGFQPSSGV